MKFKMNSIIYTIQLLQSAAVLQPFHFIQIYTYSRFET